MKKTTMPSTPLDMILLGRDDEKYKNDTQAEKQGVSLQFQRGHRKIFMKFSHGYGFQPGQNLDIAINKDVNPHIIEFTIAPIETPLTYKISNVSTSELVDCVSIHAKVKNNLYSYIQHKLEISELNFNCHGEYFGPNNYGVRVDLRKRTPTKKRQIIVDDKP